MTVTRASSGVRHDVDAPRATTAERPTVEPPLFDTSTPNIARVYNYWLGGKDNFAADRAEAERLIAVYPELPCLARQSRSFLARAVEWLAQQGVTQFLDLGCGLPTGENTHEIADAVHPDCRVVYVDDDPIVVAHARALLQCPGVSVMCGDMAEPDAILAAVRAQGLLNLVEPTAVVLEWCSIFSTQRPLAPSWPRSPAQQRQAATSCSRRDPAMSRPEGPWSANTRRARCTTTPSRRSRHETPRRVRRLAFDGTMLFHLT